MKKPVLTIFFASVVLLVIAVLAPKPFDKTLPFFAEKNADVCVYCLDANCNATDVGSGKLVHTLVQNYDQTLKNVDGVQGVSYSYKGQSSDVFALVKKFDLSVCDCYSDGSVFTVCGHSPYFIGGTTLGGKKVNLQIAFHNGVVTVGSPLILGSY